MACSRSAHGRPDLDRYVRLGLPRLESYVLSAGRVASDRTHHGRSHRRWGTWLAPVQRMGGRIWIGTSGWAYPGWNRTFYPPGVSRQIGRTTAALIDVGAHGLLPFSAWEAGSGSVRPVGPTQAGIVRSIRRACRA